MFNCPVVIRKYTLCIQNTGKNDGPYETYEILIVNDSLYETYSPSIINAGPSQCDRIAHGRGLPAMFYLMITVNSLSSPLKYRVFTLRALVGTTRGDVLVKLIP